MRLPKNWNEVTIGQYIELRPYLEMEINSTIQLIDKTIAQLHILTGKPLEEVRKIRASEVRYIQEQLEWMNQLPPTELPQIVELEGHYYTPTLYREDMSAGQFMSVTELLKESKDNPEVTWQQLHYVLVNVFKEVDSGGKPIDIDNESKWIKETADLFYNKLPFSIAYPVAVFFYKLSKELPAIIQDYSIEKAMKIMKKVEMDLVEDGDGLLH